MLTEPSDIWQQAVAGTVGGGALIMLIFKVLSFIRKEQEGQSGSSATRAQFEALQEQIKACQADNTELRAQFNLMDRKLHVQQRTITRMEMLLRQFSGLVQEKGIGVPSHMRSELEELIKDDDDRNARPMPFAERRKEHSQLGDLE